MEEELPDDVLEAANLANLELLPAKSKEKYERQYYAFEKWYEERNVKTLKEEVLLAYFFKLNKEFSPNTLWSKYSMLKSVLKIKKNVDIGKFHKLVAFIKKQNVGFQPKKSKIFSKEEISTFLNEASDDIYLLIKVATIFGLAGACRREELAKMKTSDIEDKGNLIVVKIQDSKNHTSRSFVISAEINDGKYLLFYRKYTALRPSTAHQRFFVYYKRGKCTKQCVGINSFGKMPSEIAAFLRLPNPELYTGHSFRRSSATLLANSGEGLTDIKRLGGWKSSTVAEGYIEESTSYKKGLSNKILNCSPKEPDEMPSSSNAIQKVEMQTYTIPTLTASSEPSSAFPRNQLQSAINLHHATSCTFTISIVNNNK